MEHTHLPDPQNYKVCGRCGAVLRNDPDALCGQCDYDDEFTWRETSHHVVFDPVIQESGRYNSILLLPENAKRVTGMPWLSE